MLKYRPDIDGLRAIAVGSVLVYHLQESLLPGGFVGVDIFFVISGYLITMLIFNELSDSGDFSFKRFYARRVRRLFPALFATLVFSTVLAYFLFSPTHLIEFGRSLIASIFSVSNIFFWNISDYFDSQSTLKPLLHTWSLSVEEQFYLLWPAILVGLFAFRRGKFIPAFIVAMGLLSLLLNLLIFSEHEWVRQWLTSAKRESNLDVASTAFYWLPFRVFEFAIGAILVWIGNASNNRIALATFVVGLAMVLASIFAIDDKMTFPSVTALLPCVGAALMIYSGSGHPLSWVISNKAMVAMGLISYSLYLIHWPLIVFYKYLIGREFVHTELILLAAVSVFLAYLMYRFVEQPFRKVKSDFSSPNKRFLIGSGISALTIIAISVNAVASQGWLWRYPSDVVAQLSYKKGDYTEFFWANIERLEAGFQDNSKPKVLVIGDSMAADFINVLVAGNAAKDLDIASINVENNCKTLFDLTEQQYKQIYGGASDSCRREHSRILNRVAELSNADTIVLASYWWEEPHLQYVPSTASHLKSLTRAKVLVLGVKVQINNGIRFLSKNAFEPNSHKLVTPPHPKTRRLNHLLKKQAESYSYFDLLGLFCTSRGCQRITKDGYAIIFDGTHLSEQGAAFLAQGMRDTNWYKRLLSTSQVQSGT